MADDSTSDALATGALLVGGGLAGYFAGRWLVERRKSASATTAPDAAPASGAMVPAASSPASATPRLAPAPQPPSEPKPVSSPTQVATRPPSPAHDDSSPITSPDQVPATAAQRAPSAALPRTYDPIFDRHRGDIPIEYLRALTYSESRMKPRVRARSGARGLMQITASVRVSFNVAHRTDYQPQNLDDPEINVRIGCWVLRFIATSYAKHHPAIANMHTDWRNPRFVELLTFGWNAGFSERSGVGKVVSHLESNGATAIDVELVHGNARAAGAVEHLSNPRKLSWCKGVVVLYLRERSLTEPIATPVA